MLGVRYRQRNHAAKVVPEPEAGEKRKRLSLFTGLGNLGPLVWRAEADETENYTYAIAL